MNWRIIFAPLAILIAAAPLSLGSAILLAVDVEDLHIHHDLFNARKLARVEPGAAYLYHVGNESFQRSPLCRKRKREMEITEADAPFSIYNSAGAQFGSIVDWLADFYGRGDAGPLETSGVSRSWRLVEAVNENKTASRFRRHCADRVAAAIEDPETRVYVVDTVFYARVPHEVAAVGDMPVKRVAVMVSFDVRTVLLHCDPAPGAPCAEHRETPMRPGASWPAEFKAALGLVRSR